MQVNSQVDNVDNLDELETAERLSNIPHVTIPRPSQLNRERWIFAASIVLPCLGFIGAIALAFYSGITAVDGILFLSMFFLTVLGIEVGYHRLFSHHAFETVAPVRAFLAIAGCMALQGPVIYWVSNHRRHHIYSDQPTDPHSPYFHGDRPIGLLEGFWHSHIGWIFDPERTCPGRYGRDILKDPLIMTIDKYYFVWVFLGLLIPAILGGILTWTVAGILHGFLWGGMARMFLVQQGTYGINSFCHIWGDRPFQTREKSTNNLWLTIPTLGGSLHNAHHAFPNTAVNGFEWWELDPGAWFIRGLEKLNLIWNVKVPTPEMIEMKKVD
jgi:stearoyl-CoA desaturase (delta-9 desaturase)